MWNAIDGLTALVAGDFVVADAERVVALQVAAWGWVLLALGVVEAVAGIALFVGARWARVVAVLVAGFNGVVQLAFRHPQRGNATDTVNRADIARNS